MLVAFLFNLNRVVSNTAAPMLDPFRIISYYRECRVILSTLIQLAAAEPQHTGANLEV